MAIDPPYRLDPLQNPVNVKWGGAEGEPGAKPVLVGIAVTMIRVFGGFFGAGCAIGDGPRTLKVLGSATSTVTGTLSGTAQTTGDFTPGALPHSLEAGLDATSCSGTGKDANNIVVFTTAVAFDLTFVGANGITYVGTSTTAVQFESGADVTGGFGEGYRYSCNVILTPTT